MVADVRLEHRQPVELGRPLASDRRLPRGAALGHVLRREEEVPDREHDLAHDRERRLPSRSWVSLTGPTSELSIGSTPYSTSRAATASATARNDGSGSVASPGKSAPQATALCAPSRPGYAIAIAIRWSGA